MKLGLVIKKEFQDSFQKLLKQEKIPPKTAFKLRGVIKTMKEALEKHNELNGEYLKQYSLKEEDGSIKTVKLSESKTVVKLDPETAAEYNEKMSELNNIDVEFPEIKLSELGPEDKLTLTPEDFFFLEFLAE